MGGNQDWIQLRRLIEKSVESMAWRLETLSEVDRIGFVDELTDLLINEVTIGRP